jgi:transcriptional regulator with XRE-family HTH domain
MKAKRKPATTAEWYIAFGQRFRVTREALGITEQEAAEAYGVSLGAYRRLEKGANQRGRHYNLVRFAQKFNLSYQWLIEGKGKITKPAPARPRPHLVWNRDTA